MVSITFVLSLYLGFSLSQGFVIPTDIVSAFTCLIPGLKDLICTGNRIVIGQEPASKKDGLGFFGYKTGADLRFLRDLGLGNQQQQFIRNTDIGTSYGVNLGKNSIDFGQSSGLLNLLKNQRGGRLEWGQNRPFRFGMGETNNAWGNNLDFRNVDAFEWDPNTFQTRIRKQKTIIPGVLEEREHIDLDPRSLNFGTRKYLCIFKNFCFNAR